VLHRGGSLRLERCALVCDAGGLEHLFACLVTTACAQVGRAGVKGRPLGTQPGSLCLRLAALPN
jgi:hypothetical protein